MSGRRSRARRTQAAHGCRRLSPECTRRAPKFLRFRERRRAPEMDRREEASTRWHARVHPLLQAGLSGESLLYVAEEVVDVFDSAREPDETFGDAKLGASLLRHRSVCHRRGVTY